MADIAHVVVLMLENRSFDHLLGFVPHPDRAFDGLLGGTHSNPGWRRGPAVTASPTAKKVLPVGPDHSHDAVMLQLALRGGKPANRGFVRSYERKARNLDPPVFGGLLGTLANWVRDLQARRPPGRDGPGPAGHGVPATGERAGAGPAGDRVRGVFPLVLLGAGRDVAEPQLRACGDLGRPDRDRDPPVHQPDDLRIARVHTARTGGSIYDDTPAGLGVPRAVGHRRSGTRSGSRWTASPTTSPRAS